VEHKDEDFGIYHRGELREALIMIEGDDGAFELLAHGSIPKPTGDVDWASVRSSNSDAEYLLIHDRDHRPGVGTCWHLADEAERMIVQRSRSRG
jgi:hypothetical protein